MRRLTVFVALLLLVGGAAANAQSLTGTVAGKVTDEQGGVLPGVTVTLTGRTGAQVTVTDEKGEYRFVGLNPGPYEVKVELAGFTPRTERNLDVGIGRTLTVPFTLRVGGVAETVEVVANASTIDTASTASENSLSQELLSNIPINMGNFNAAANLMNYAPGINGTRRSVATPTTATRCSSTAWTRAIPRRGRRGCSTTSTSSRKSRSAAWARRPSTAGSAGAVVNTITKSGGNRYSGLFDFRHTNDSLAGDNIKEEYLASEPGARLSERHHEVERLHRPDGRAVQQGQGVLVVQRAALRLRSGSRRS